MSAARRPWRRRHCEGQSGGYKRIKLPSYVADIVDQKPKGPIGVVTIAGTIVDGKAPLGTAGGDTIALAIENGIRDKEVKALVVRVDSPGGSVLASERIRQALIQAKEKKLPVVVSMGSVAASGGYWVSTPADFIYAEPSTITGSIGVFGVLPSFQGTLQKLGVGADGVKTTPLSGEPDLLKGPSPEASRLIQTGVESTYRRFLGIVAESRHKSPADIDKIAQGRVWDGGTARQLGLVDGFGGMSEAIAKAGDLAHLDKNDRGVRYLEQPKSFRDQLLDAWRRAATTVRRRRMRSGCSRLCPAAARVGDRRGAHAPRRPQHPGALPRMPAGRACARFDQPRRELARDGGEMAVLIRRRWTVTSSRP